MNDLQPHQSPVDKLPELLRATLDKQPIPLDAEEAAAGLIAHLTRNDTVLGAEAAFYSLRRDIECLQDGDPAAIRRTLARHACVLDALQTHLIDMVASGRLKRSENIASVSKAAAVVQQANLRTLISLGAIGMREVRDAE
jgi:hypothetical protein